jgi:DNA excision repair protein ERCC-4
MLDSATAHNNNDKHNDVKSDASKKPKRSCGLTVIPREAQMILCTYEKKKNHDLLNEFQPNYVVLYDPDVAFIRELEVYHGQTAATTTNSQEGEDEEEENALHVYFMVYEESAEQQAYLTELKREKV